MAKIPQNTIFDPEVGQESSPDPNLYYGTGSWKGGTLSASSSYPRIPAGCFFLHRDSDMRDKLGYDNQFIAQLKGYKKEGSNVFNCSIIDTSEVPWAVGNNVYTPLSNFGYKPNLGNTIAPGWLPRYSREISLSSINTINNYKFCFQDHIEKNGPSGALVNVGTGTYQSMYLNIKVYRINNGNTIRVSSKYTRDSSDFIFPDSGNTTVKNQDLVFSNSTQDYPTYYTLLGPRMMIALVQAGGGGGGANFGNNAGGGGNSGAAIVFAFRIGVDTGDELMVSLGAAGMGQRVKNNDPSDWTTSTSLTDNTAFPNEGITCTIKHSKSNQTISVEGGKGAHGRLITTGGGTIINATSSSLAPVIYTIWSAKGVSGGQVTESGANNGSTFTFSGSLYGGRDSVSISNSGGYSSPTRGGGGGASWSSEGAYGAIKGGENSYGAFGAGGGGAYKKGSLNIASEGGDGGASYFKLFY